MSTLDVLSKCLEMVKEASKKGFDIVEFEKDLLQISSELSEKLNKLDKHYYVKLKNLVQKHSSNYNISNVFSSSNARSSPKSNRLGQKSKVYQELLEVCTKIENAFETSKMAVDQNFSNFSTNIETINSMLNELNIMNTKARNLKQRSVMTVSQANKTLQELKMNLSKAEKLSTTIIQDSIPKIVESSCAKLTNEKVEPNQFSEKLNESKLNFAESTALFENKSRTKTTLSPQVSFKTSAVNKDSNQLTIKDLEENPKVPEMFFPVIKPIPKNVKPAALSINESNFQPNISQIKQGPFEVQKPIPSTIKTPLEKKNEAPPLSLSNLISKQSEDKEDTPNQILNTPKPKMFDIKSLSQSINPSPIIVNFTKDSEKEKKTDPLTKNDVKLENGQSQLNLFTPLSKDPPKPNNVKPNELVKTESIKISPIAKNYSKNKEFFRTMYNQSISYSKNTSNEQNVKSITKMINLSINTLSRHSGLEMIKRIKFFADLINGKEVDTPNGKFKRENSDEAQMFTMHTVFKAILAQIETIILNSKASAFPPSILLCSLFEMVPSFKNYFIGFFLFKYPFILNDLSSCSELITIKELKSTQYQELSKLSSKDLAQKLSKIYESACSLLILSLTLDLPPSINLSSTSTNELDSLSKIWEILVFAIKSIADNPDLGYTICESVLEFSGEKLFSTYKNQFKKVIDVLLENVEDNSADEPLSNNGLVCKMKIKDMIYKFNESQKFDIAEGSFTDDFWKT